MMDRTVIYSLIYALAAAGGREKALFGPHASRAAEAFGRSAPGEAFPELWFELPLSGDPWFDLHALTAAGDLPAGALPAADACGGYPDVFRWFSSAEDARQLALSWDLNNGGEPAAAIQLLLSRPNLQTACDFMQAAGKPDAAPAYRAFLRNTPPEWFACYTGIFPSRPGHFLRVECIPTRKLQQAYAQDPSLLARHLGRLGLAQAEESILPWCRMLASAPFQLEFQFDVREDGSPGATFSASLRFAMVEDQSGYLPFRVNGPAGSLMEEIERQGLADGRWRLLEGTAFSQKLSFRGESCLLYCAPVFVKLRWREGRPLDAKAYLIAGAQ